MTESDLLAAIDRLCARHDVWHYHAAAHPVAPRYRGFPDLVLVGTERGCFRELKAESARVTVDQRRVGAMLRTVGWDWEAWRPADLASGRIETELAALSGRRPWGERCAP